MNLDNLGRSHRHSVTSPPSPWEPERRKHTARYLHDVRTAAEEPAPWRGQVYIEQPDGSTQVLKDSGQTTPTAGPDGPDIPDTAVHDNRVFMYVDGIRTTLGNEKEDILKLFESDGGDPSLTNVGQPTVGIQEGVGSSALSDGWRIVKDFEGLKALQRGDTSEDEIASLYATDPAIKSVHDELRQSLEAGRDVLLAAHSGGGAETAVALTLLSKEEGGHFAQAIADHVRVIEAAPAASMQDFELAGVRPENLYYTASDKDPVYGAFHTFVPPDSWTQTISNALSGLADLARPGAMAHHSPYNIFAHNLTDGQSDIQKFIDGAPNGGDHTFSD